MRAFLKKHLTPGRILALVLFATVSPFRTVVNLNWESFAQKHEWDKILLRNEGPVVSALTDVAHFLASDLALGIAIGGLLFSFRSVLTWPFRQLWPKGDHVDSMEQLVQSSEEGDAIEVVAGAQFINETIMLDGKRFVNCQFEKCTVKYNGGICEFHDCNFVPHVWLTSDVPGIVRGMVLMSHMAPGAESFVDGRGQERHIMRLTVAAPEQPPDIAETALRRDVRAAEAIAYVTTRRWDIALGHLANDSQSGAYKAYKALEQAAADEDIPMWGRRKEYTVYEPIPAEFWRANKIDWLELLRDNPRTTPHDHLARKDLGYLDVMTSRAAIERVWPPRETPKASDPERQ